jgi:DNA polymerase III delta subunit
VSKWTNPPPVTVIAGTQDFYRRRELQAAADAADRNGRRVERLMGSDRDGLSRLLSATGVFFSEKVLVIVHKPDGCDPEMVLSHGLQKDNDVAVLLHYEGDLEKVRKKSTVAQVVGKIDKRFTANFLAPKPWEAQEFAEKFVRKEARGLKLTIEPTLVSNLVTIVGSDLGVLSYELRKALALCKGAGTMEVTGPMLRSSVAAIMEAGAQPVVEYLGQRQVARLARALTAMRRTHASDPTMKGIAFVGRNVLQWVQAASLISAGISPEEISREMEVNPWIFRNKISPIAKKWGEKNLADLLSDLADIERGIKSGHINPWVEFESALIRASARARRG